MDGPPSAYRDYETEAHELVQRVIQASLHRLQSERDECSIHIWPASDEFTVDVGLKQVAEYVKDWQVGESWRHCVDYIGCRDDELHCYWVQWSEPTRRRPVPTATASIYFYIRVHQNSSAPVSVFYVVEGQRLVHRPDKSAFREVWLRRVIDNKLAVFSSVRL